jgi:predicted nucleic acid-binding protein
MYLIDTNVLSELRKVRSGRADSGVAAWVAALDATGIFVSAISFFGDGSTLM